jgi:tight adherence protein B
MVADVPAGIFVGGLVLVYLAAAILFGIVLSPRQGVPLSRRRPDAQDRVSGLTKLTAHAVGRLNKGLKHRGTGLLSAAKFEQAGLKRQPGDYLLMAAGLTFTVTVIGFFLDGLFMAIIFFIASPFTLYLALNFLRSRRRRKFDDQVPDTLQMFSGGLRAGHSLLRSVDAAAQENEAPMAEELSRIVNETRIGRDLGDSIKDVAERTQNEDFNWIAQAIDIHREVGGDLAEVLDHLGETIRDRNQIRGQVRALSAEGRMSAMVLMALPIVMFFGLLLTNELFARTFTTTVPGYIMIAAVVVLLTVGGFWLNRIIKPKF